jgi:hypothetical protein
VARDFLAYHLIAIEAGRRKGMALPDKSAVALLDEREIGKLVAAVAEHPAAVALRDELTAEFDRRMQDRGFTGDDLAEWFVPQFGKISRVSIYRCRASRRNQESRIREVAEQARAFRDAVSEDGADALTAAAASRASQLFFSLLMEVDSAEIDEDRSDKLVNIVNALSKLRKTDADIRLANARLAEAAKAAKASVAATATPAGQVSADEVYAILDRVMKGQA